MHTVCYVGALGARDVRCSGVCVRDAGCEVQGAGHIPDPGPGSGARIRGPEVSGARIRGL